MNRLHQILSLAIFAALIAGLLGNPETRTAYAQPAAPDWQAPPSTGDCRFGTTFSGWGPPDNINRYDFPEVGLGYLLDWKYQKSASIPGSIRYVAELSVSDASFPGTLAGLPAALAANPGGIWIVGNEPDDRGQEHVTPEVYAERLFQYAALIRTDPSAKIGFGTIVMPTALRLMYLDFTWTRLIQLAGSQSAASALIDIWTPHNFILNEQGGVDANGSPYWGSGVPWGFETRNPTVNWQALQETIPLDQLPAKLYDLSTFKTRLIRFRQWLKDHGEQNKPVWLTEYGQLAPPMTTPQDNLWTVPDLTTARFMLDTLDWMLTYKDKTLGQPGDQNRLVQKWFWFSINHSRYQFGGTLLDPETLLQTPVGYAWANYVPPAGSIEIRQPDLYPLQVTPQFLSFNPSNRQQVSYTLDVRIRNAIIADHFVDLQVTVKNGSKILASGTGRAARCGGDAVLTFALKNIAVLPQTSICVEVQPITKPDLNPANNTLCVQLPTKFFYFPFMLRD